MNEYPFSPVAVAPPLPTPMLAPPWGWRALAKATGTIVLGTVVVAFVIMGIALALGSDLTAASGMTATPLFVLGIAIYVVVVLEDETRTTESANALKMMAALHAY